MVLVWLDSVPQSRFVKPAMKPITKGSPGKNSSASPGDSPDEKLAEVPQALFYPFYPESQTNNYGAQTMGQFGFQPSSESYMLEEKDPVSGSAGMQPWSSSGVSRAAFVGEEQAN